MKKYTSATDFVNLKQNFSYFGLAGCGVDTVRRALCLKRSDACPRKIAMHMDTRIAVIRHPIKRLMSAYNHSGLSWQDFWKKTKNDPTWCEETTPYWVSLGNDYTELYTLEKMNNWIPHLSHRYSLPAAVWMGKRNSKIPSKLPSGVDQEIRSVYAADLALWQRTEDKP